MILNYDITVAYMDCSESIKPFTQHNSYDMPRFLHRCDFFDAMKTICDDTLEGVIHLGTPTIKTLQLAPVVPNLEAEINHPLL